MTRRPIKFEAVNLTLSEVVILQRAAQQDFVYGYEFNESLGESVSKNGAVYKRLRVLARYGFLEGRLESDEESRRHGGAARRLHSITEAGRAMVTEALALLEIEEAQALTEDMRQEARAN